MIPPNGFAKPDRVVKTYSFGGGKELVITQEVGDCGTFWSAQKNGFHTLPLYLDRFGRWNENLAFSSYCEDEKKLLALIKKS